MMEFFQPLRKERQSSSLRQKTKKSTPLPFHPPFEPIVLTLRRKCPGCVPRPPYEFQNNELRVIAFISTFSRYFVGNHDHPHGIRPHRTRAVPQHHAHLRTRGIWQEIAEKRRNKLYIELGSVRPCRFFPGPKCLLTHPPSYLQSSSVASSATCPWRLYCWNKETDETTVRLQPSGSPKERCPLPLVMLLLRPSRWKSKTLLGLPACWGGWGEGGKAT